MNMKVEVELPALLIRLFSPPTFDSRPNGEEAGRRGWSGGGQSGQD